MTMMLTDDAKTLGGPLPFASSVLPVEPYSDTPKQEKPPEI